MGAVNLLEKGRAIGYTPEQVRKTIREQKELLERENRIQEVLDCKNLEDIKILLIHWIDNGYMK